MVATLPEKYQWRKAPKSTFLRGMGLCLKNAAGLLKAARIVQQAGLPNAAFVLASASIRREVCLSLGPDKSGVRFGPRSQPLSREGQCMVAAGDEVLSRGV